MNKKLLQVELLSRCRMTLKDLHNLGCSREVVNDLEATLKYLLEKKDSFVELVTGEDGVLLGIFYQDKEMRRMYSCYPEVLFVDAIHKVCNRRMPLYIFLVEDGNGKSEFAGLFLAAREDAVTMREMVRVLKKLNPDWERTLAVMTDKDFQERKAFGEEFPGAVLLICIFHVMRAFRREITVEKMCITSGEKDMCLELLVKLVYAKNEEVYNSVFNELRESGLERVVQYMEENWHGIRNEWVVSLQQKSVTLGNRTNNRVESMNSKVVDVVKRNSNLPELFKNLDALILSLRTERDNDVAQTQLRVPISLHIESEEQRSYLQILTPYAYRFVCQKLKEKDNVVIEGCGDGDVVEVKSGEGRLNTSVDKCSCSFWCSMELPCQHIFRVRELKHISLFSEGLVAKRWTKGYYVSSSRLARKPARTGEEDEMSRPCTSATVRVLGRPKVLSENERFKFVREKGLRVASLASEASGPLFLQRAKVLESLIQLWSENREVKICDVTVEREKSVFLSEAEALGRNEAQSEVLGVDAGDEVGSDLILPSSVNEGEHCSQLVFSGPVSQSLQTLPKLPAKMKRRGRPKGCDKTVIGLPVQKKRKKVEVSEFARKPAGEKEELMLGWFLTDEDRKLAVGGKVMDEEAVERSRNKVSSGCLDGSVRIKKLERFFTCGAWQLIQRLIAEKKKNPLWFCPLCKQDSSNSSVCCNSCLEWYHMDCVGTKKIVKKKFWFCRSCKDVFKWK